MKQKIKTQKDKAFLVKGRVVSIKLKAVKTGGKKRLARIFPLSTGNYAYILMKSTEFALFRKKHSIQANKTHCVIKTNQSLILF